MTHRIALVGGTGPEGRGLATRFAIAGHEVRIGSRNAERGEQIAGELAASLGRDNISGGDNASMVAGCDLVVVVVPYEAHRPTLESLREEIGTKVVVDAVVPVRFERGPRPVEVAAGSATEEAKELLPEATVIGAFHNCAADVLMDSAASVDADVLVTGPNGEAKQTVMDLADEIEGVRAVDAGPLRFSRFVEDITILLIGINGRYKTHTGVQISGLDGHGAAS
jgi:NADPH-dependent F420 reductase